MHLGSSHLIFLIDSNSHTLSKDQFPRQRRNLGLLKALTEIILEFIGHKNKQFTRGQVTLNIILKSPDYVQYHEAIRQ